jgi:hypothetical protein
VDGCHDVYIFGEKFLMVCQAWTVLSHCTPVLGFIYAETLNAFVDLTTDSSLKYIINRRAAWYYT